MRERSLTRFKNKITSFSMDEELKEIGLAILKAGAMEIRDVDAGQAPFVYSTGNRGPGYVMIKGLVGQPRVLKFLTRKLAEKLVRTEVAKQIDFVDGNATGGMVPAWQLASDLSEVTGKEYPYCYLRGARKEGGHGEMITGDRNNPLIQKGMRALIVEELVNFAGTTTNAAEEFRAAGYQVDWAACILGYDHPESRDRLKEKKLSLAALITLPELIEAAREAEFFPSRALASYEDFLRDPVEWQLERKLVVPEPTAQKAISRGISMRKLAEDEAAKLGAPKKEILGSWWAKA